MTLSILSSRDADPNIEYSLSFTVSYGPPTLIECKSGSTQIFSAEGSNSSITREVIRSHFINSSLADMTRVIIRLPPQPRIESAYNCTVSVRVPKNIGTTYSISSKGTGFSNINVTGE